MNLAPVVALFPGIEIPEQEERYTRQQRQEDLLYFDLDVANRLRRDMERLDTWTDEFLFKKIERDAAMQSARERLVILRGWNHPLTADLAERCLWEGA